MAPPVRERLRSLIYDEASPLDAPADDADEDIADIASAMLGDRWTSFASPEAAAFRRSFDTAYTAAVRDAGGATRTTTLPDLPTHLLPPLPPGDPLGNKALLVVAHLSDADSPTRIQAPLSQPADLLITAVVRRISARVPSFRLSAAEAVLRVVGKLEYLYGPSPLRDFPAARAAAKSQADLHVFVRAGPARRRAAAGIVRVNGAMLYSGLPLNVTRLPGAQPLGAGDGPLALVVSGVHHVPCPARAGADGAAQPPLVAVVVEVVHGARRLCEPMRTQWAPAMRPLDPPPTPASASGAGPAPGGGGEGVGAALFGPTKGALTFDIPLACMPPAARVVFSVIVGADGVAPATLARLPASACVGRIPSTTTSVGDEGGGGDEAPGPAAAPPMGTPPGAGSSPGTASQGGAGVVDSIFAVGRGIVSSMSAAATGIASAGRGVARALASAGPAQAAVYQCIARCAVPYFRFDGAAQCGALSLQMWPNVPDPLAACCHTTALPLAFDAPTAPTLSVSFLSPASAASASGLPGSPGAAAAVARCAAVLPASDATKAAAAARQRTALAKLPKELRAEPALFASFARRAAGADMLRRLGDVEVAALWEYREELSVLPGALPRVMVACNWACPASAAEARAMLARWAPLAPAETLELLDSRHADPDVRAFAVGVLGGLPSSALQVFLPQLVQALKYEAHHDSALARFLLSRAVDEPYSIGHDLFWLLYSEVGVPRVAERFALMCEEIIRRGGLRRELLRQWYVLQKVEDIAVDIKDVPLADRRAAVREKLGKLRLPPTFLLPLDTRTPVGALRVDKCKCMDSKKVPLWLVFQNADAAHMPPERDASVITMFKAGDDLRQDQLTIQAFSVFDMLWRAHGLDLHLNCYKVVSCGESIGFIEIVRRADTVANITRAFGGANAAFAPEPLFAWLRSAAAARAATSPAAAAASPPAGGASGAVTTAGGGVTAEEEQCIVNFCLSMAGYAVATYVLGIGDRHNDNIMLQDDGNLFHIDFGHFLGNFKEKFGFKRETAPFVFTPMYAYVLGGASTHSIYYLRFRDIACRAFVLARAYKSLLVSLFALMLPTGIPELNRPEDILWLKTVLEEGADDDAAARAFERKIDEARTNKRVMFNDFIHIKAHSS